MIPKKRGILDLTNEYMKEASRSIKENGKDYSPEEII
jgi:hypothetical protein